MIYFTHEFFHFFESLAAHNQRDWFMEHKAVYEKQVKEPFQHFITDLLTALSEQDSAYAAFKPQDFMMRIYRDVRFSKDKTPYQTHAGAWLSPGGKKSELPGYYLHFAPEESFMAIGRYSLTPEQLYKVRQEISYHSQEFEKLLHSAPFKNRFGAMLGETTKLAPRDFKEEAEKNPLLKHKQFYFSTPLNKDVVTSNKLLPTVLELYTLAAPVNAFFTRAMG